jgi:hypothetical protein
VYVAALGVPAGIADLHVVAIVHVDRTCYPPHAATAHASAGCHVCHFALAQF